MKVLQQRGATMMAASATCRVLVGLWSSFRLNWMTRTRRKGTPLGSKKNLKGSSNWNRRANNVRLKNSSATSGKQLWTRKRTKERKRRGGGKPKSGESKKRKSVRIVRNLKSGLPSSKWKIRAKWGNSMPSKRRNGHRDSSSLLRSAKSSIWRI